MRAIDASRQARRDGRRRHERDDAKRPPVTAGAQITGETAWFVTKYWNAGWQTFVAPSFPARCWPLTAGNLTRRMPFSSDPSCEGRHFMTLETELMAIEDNFWTGGPEAYQRYTDESCLVAFGESAGVMSRNDIAGSAEKGRWTDVSFEPKGMVQLSDASAVVTYECRARRKDGKPYRALVSSGYVKRGDSWKLAFHQQTPLQ
jgi:hypothetical protein